MTVRAAYALVALLAAVVGRAGAQDVPARLTLNDALALARERNPEYRQALNRLTSAQAQVRIGVGRFLPNLSASMGWGLYSSTRVTGEDDFGEPRSLPDPITYRSSSASQGLSAQLTLFDGLSNLRTYRASRASADATLASAELTLLRVEAETTRRFYDALRTRGLIAVEEGLLASAREQLANTERLFRTAGATRADVLGAQTDVAAQELALARARGDARKAGLALREYLGLTEAIEFAVAGELPAVFDPSVLDADSLVARAYSANPQVRQLELQVHAASLAAAAARGQRWPSLSLSGSFSRSMSLSSYDALFEVNPQNRGLGFNIGVSFPLFQRFQTSAQIAQAEVEARNAEQQLLAGRLAVARGARSALIDLGNAYRALGLAEQMADLSRQRLAFARERYALASLDFTALQQIINQANEAERQLVNARFDFARAVVGLEEAVGIEVR